MPSKMISDELASRPNTTAAAASSSEAAMDSRSTPCSVRGSRKRSEREDMQKSGWESAAEAVPHHSIQTTARLCDCTGAGPGKVTRLVTVYGLTGAHLRRIFSTTMTYKPL